MAAIKISASEAYPKSDGLSTPKAVSYQDEKNLSGIEQIINFNIQKIATIFDDYFEQESKKVFDLVFIDGHHDGEALKKYLVALEPLIHKDTILILDDIRWSNSMITAWNDIVSSANYCVTIDLFRVGIIVKRPQQYKEHFVIRM